MFINVNTHSYYSLLEATISIDDIISFAKTNNQKYVFLTDNNLYASIEFYNKSVENNLIPIIGLDIFYNNSKLIIFPTSNIGYKNLIKISSNVLQNKNFDINNFIEDILIIFNGEKINNINPKHFFTRNTRQNTNININECRYLISEDSLMLNIMNSIKMDQKIDLSEKKDNSKYFLDQKEFEKIHKENTWINHDKFINLVNWKREKPKAEIILFPLEEKIDSKTYLSRLCNDSLTEKFINYRNIDVYKKRLDYELGIIDSMGFNDYFLIVHDFIAEAIKNNILVGPGRGSSAGSLVSFLLSITKVDPIKYGLIFERFLNPNRYSLPDIDIDIMDTKREKIIDYIFEKYGHNHVAHIVTFQRIKAKMALRDVGRVLDIDLKIINRISKLVSSEYEHDLLGAVAKNKELKDFYERFKDLFIFASKLIGAPRQTGTHAAGIVLSKEELTNVVPIQYGVNNVTTTQVSMEYLEPLGLLKIDLLGLSNLTTIFNVIKLVKIMNNIEIDLYSIPLNDEKVFKEISKANTLGIFQLESPGMRSTLKKIKPNNIEDISLVSALFRPGPQKNIPIFVKRRFSNEIVDFIDKRIEDILMPTNGIIVYQEQVIEIVKRVANFSAADADIFRKIISKKESSEMHSLKDKFIKDSILNNYTKEIAQEIFNYIEKFASYGFNHCHSISYALISYWMVYLKTKFPLQFMSVLLRSCENSHEKIIQYCDESIRLGLEIERPNINLSLKNFAIIKMKIFFGFSSIKGIGYETGKKIVNIRNEQENKVFKNFEECVAALSKGGVGESTIDTLICSGSFDVFEKSKKHMIENVKEAIDVSKNITKNNEYLFSPKWKEVEESQEDTDNFILRQKELLGFDFLTKKNNFFNDVMQKMPNISFNSLIDISETENDLFYKVFIQILNVNIRTTKFGKEMAFIRVADDSYTDRIACFNYPNLKDMLVESTYVIATIKSNSRGKQLINIDEVIKHE